MSYLRWAFTALAFPIAGWLAVQVAGESVGPLSAAITGAVAGALIGAAQWAALGRIAGWRWVIATALGLGAGGALASLLTAGSITVPALALTGLVTGGLVGAGQGIALGRGARTALVWAIGVALSWTIGWVVSALVITTGASGFVIFGISGAVVVTILTGWLLRRILGSRPAPETPPAAVGNLAQAGAVR